MATYTVQRGDSLSIIAGKMLGDINRWRELAALNNIANPDLIKIGQVLRLPDSVAINGAIPPPPDDVPEIVDPGTGKSSLEVTAPPFPWVTLALIAAGIYFTLRK